MASGDYCTSANFEIAPGLWTHNHTREQLTSLPEFGCCQKFVCGLPCPKEFDASQLPRTWGVAIVVAAALCIIMGIIVAVKTIKGDYKNFFICSRSLPLWVLVFTLLGQGLDSNATLGNVAASYKFAFWDGAVLPMGLGISLIINGLILAHKINRMGLLTLPDLFRRKYGALMEVIVSLIEMVSFTCLLAGNLVGTSLLLQFCFNLPKWAGVVIAGVLMASYTMAGGMFSIAYVDVPQACFGFTGLLVVTIYALVTDGVPAANTSLGFALPLGDNITAVTPGYNGSLTCSDPLTNATTCDNFAYPTGDFAVNPKAMTDIDAYNPFPNAIVMNWATLFVLGLGNLCALDFQARSMAAKSPLTARLGNIIAGIVLMGLCVPFGLLGGFARKWHGPDSEYAEFEADTCSAPLGLPSCAQWMPQERMVLFMYMWDKLPRVLGGWVMVAILCASMSTATGAILSTSTVLAHNIWRKVPKIGSKESNMLMIVRLFTVPMTVIACGVAAAAYNPGYLLVVAFDVVLAGCLVPLLAAVYWPSITPNAGLIACVCGSVLRITLEFVLPKDGSLVLWGTYALQFGKAVAGLPTFMEVPEDANMEGAIWDPAKDTCDQVPMRDWTGIDSIVSPFFCLAVLVTVWGLERMFPGRDLLFWLPKSWRQTEPLYQLTDGAALADTASDMVKDADVVGSLPATAADLKDKPLDQMGKLPSGTRDDSAHYNRTANRH